MLLLDTAHNFGRLRARLKNRPYWQLVYTDGDVVSEWSGIDWKDAPFKARSAVRLFCPNGEIVELGSGDSTGKLFQFKVAVIRFGQGRSTLAHVIGCVTDDEGNCIYAAWDSETGSVSRGTDNVYAMKYHQTGRLSFEVMGLKL